MVRTRWSTATRKTVKTSANVVMTSTAHALIADTPSPCHTGYFEYSHRGDDPDRTSTDRRHAQLN
jgi:hypothetical protein